MASSPTDILRLELQATGENANTWGDKTNTNISLIEKAIAGRTSLITLAASNVTLTTTNYADDQARNMTIALNGTLSANVAVICPTKSKLYLVDNATTGAFTVTFRTVAGTGVAVPQGKVSAVYCDGVNVVGINVTGGVDADTLDGLDGSAYAKIASRNAYTAGNADVLVTLADAATVSLDCATGNVFKVTLGGNRTLNIANAVDGAWLELYITQDVTGDRTLAWPGNIIWRGGGAPTLTTAANGTDKVFLRYDADITSWFADFYPNFNSGGGSTLSDITLETNQVCVDAYALAGSPAGAVTLTIRVDQGVVISSNSALTPALDLRGFVSGSVIALVNLGYILGHGGQGGNGGNASAQGDNTTGPEAGRAGVDAGPAITLPGAGRTINITNASGFIWGGGGGGGGGGATTADAAVTGAVGGGGGGGAGSGLAGQAGSCGLSDNSTITATHGVNGGNGRLGDFGAGGIGAQSGTADGGNGGAGGTWGAAGTAGESPTAQAKDVPGGAAGAAGAAVAVNGGVATFINGGSAPNVKGAIS